MPWVVVTAVNCECACCGRKIWAGSRVVAAGLSGYDPVFCNRCEKPPPPKKEAK